MSEHRVTIADIQKLLTAVETAEQELSEAQMQEDQARRRKVDLLNKANNAQRALDDHIWRFMKQSPRDTDWHRKANAIRASET